MADRGRGDDPFFRHDAVAARMEDAHHKEREVLFSNEAFVIGALQATAGGSVFGVISQTDKLIELVSRVGFLLFLTCMASALILAVLASYWKHQYKMWDVK